MTARRKIATGLMAVTAAAGVGVISAPVAARAAETTSTTVPKFVEVPGSGLSFTGAVITAPGKPTRHLDAYQTAAFSQAWIGAAFLTKPKHEPIPKNLTVYRLDVTGTWGGGSEFLPRPVFYASDGARVWIAFPPPLTVPANGAPAKLDWFVAPPRTIAGFAGTLKMLETAAETPSTTVASAPAESSGSSGGSAWPWIIGAFAVVAIVGGVLGVRRERARKA